MRAVRHGLVLGLGCWSILLLMVFCAFSGEPGGCVRLRDRDLGEIDHERLVLDAEARAELGEKIDRYIATLRLHPSFLPRRGV